MILIVDLSNLIWSSFHTALASERVKIDPENVPDGYSNHMYTFQQKLERIINELAATSDGEEIRYTFALDERPRRKYKIYADYKKGRKKISFDPKPAIMALLESWQAETIASTDNEADDVIAAYIAEHIDENIVVASTDKDLWQLLENPSTKIFNFHKDSMRFVTEDDLQKAFKLDKFTHIKLHKSLWGDAGDNVPNLVPRMQKQLLPIVKQTDGTLEDLDVKIHENWDSLTSRCQELYKTNRNKIQINYELVKLDFDCKLKIGRCQVAPSV